MRKPCSRAYNRDVSRRKALRKRKMVRDFYGSNCEYYNNLHQYSKNKIHCSCMMCSSKTRNKGKRRSKSGNYAPSINYKISDLRRLDSMDSDERDCFYTPSLLL